MKKYVYPAVFTAENNGSYSVLFPDLENCYTCGDDLADAIDMAKDVLALTLYRYETNNISIPLPTSSKSIRTDKNSFVNLICADTLEYRKMYNSKAVKKP